jgi:hypothetical protein
MLSKYNNVKGIAYKRYPLYIKIIGYLPKDNIQ